jgi:hypothetical protein
MSALKQNAFSMSLASLMFIGALLVQLSGDNSNAGAPTSPSSRASKANPNSEEGRKIYHGNLICAK